MSHMIDGANNRSNIAYVGAKPWHGLGQELTAGADLETWRREAGLDWTVKEAPVQYQNGELRTWDARKVLFRSDNGAALSVMAKGYNVVQPADVLNLYSEIAKAGGFTLETAGSLDEGRRIWALAKVHDGADVVERDRVRPYILVATSFDGSMATTAKFTAVRVVCHNTITQAVGAKASEKQEARIVHSVKWDEDVAKRVRLQLGIVHSQFERFMVEARALAGKPMPDQEADDFVRDLLEPYVSKGADGKRDVRESKGYQRIMALFNGAAMGDDLAHGSRWGMLNAVTQLVDHERGRSDSTRLESAWFGTGAAIKERAYAILNGEFERV